MNELQKVNSNIPVPIPADPTGVGVSVALEGLQKALSAAVEAARNHEIGQTQRAAILAQKEVQIAQISGEIQRGMKSDRWRHEERMELIGVVKELLVSHANELTPNIISAAQMLLQALKE